MLRQRRAQRGQMFRIRMYAIVPEPARPERARERAVLSHARIAGTRALPEHIHQGLMPDHRNYALGWLTGAAFAAMPLSIWAAAAPPDRGQSWPLALGLVVFSGVALGLVIALWSGPFPNLFPSTTAWFERRRDSRRG